MKSPTATDRTKKKKLDSAARGANFPVGSAQTYKGHVVAGYSLHHLWFDARDQRFVY